jgi:hypothetical protein
LADFAGYVAGLNGAVRKLNDADPSTIGPEYPHVFRPQQVSDWERILYRALYAAGLRSIPQYSVEQYDLDFAIIVGDRRLNIEVDGERYHRSWTGELCLRGSAEKSAFHPCGSQCTRRAHARSMVAGPAPEARGLKIRVRTSETDC